VSDCVYFRAKAILGSESTEFEQLSCHGIGAANERARPVTQAKFAPIDEAFVAHVPAERARRRFAIDGFVVYTAEARRGDHARPFV
jgi:hypothetical protein